MIDVRHFWRVRTRIAEIRVPAWPMPIQKTKFVMSHAQPTGWLFPQTPTPVETRYARQARHMSVIGTVTPIENHHHVGVLSSTIELM